MSFAGRVAIILRGESPVLLVVGRLGATALAFVTAPVIARAIGPIGRGETAAALAAFAIAPILLAFGVPLEIRRLAAIGQAAESLRTSRVICVLAVPVAAALGLLGYFTLFLSFAPGARIVAAVGVAMSPLAMTWMCDLGVLIATGRLRGVMFMQLLQPVIYLLAVVAFWMAGMIDTTTVLIANLTGTIATCVLGMALTRVSVRGDHYPFRQMLRGSLRFAGSSMAEAASTRLDQMVALPLIGAFQAGIYSAAVNVAALPFALGQALGASYFPLVARAEGENRRLLKEQSIRVSTAIALLCVPVMVSAIWIGIPLLFGNEFSSAIPVAWLSLAGTCTMIVAYVCSMALAAEGHGNRMTVAQTLSLGVAMGLLFLLAPQWGALGAAAASSLGYATLLVLLLAGMGVRFRPSLPTRRDFSLAVLTLVRPSEKATPVEADPA